MSWIIKPRNPSIGMLASLGITLSLVALSGCNKGESISNDGRSAPAATSVDNSHSGWWCVEHGVPEEECARCDSSLVAKFKEAGDWCKEHNRPESQCFICGPKRFDKFVARYEAKTGHKPPQPEK